MNTDDHIIFWINLQSYTLHQISIYNWYCILLIPGNKSLVEWIFQRYFMTAWLPLPIPQKLTRYLWKVRDQAGHGNWEYCQGQDPKFPPISELWIERQCGKVEMRKVSAFYAQSKGNSQIIESHMKRLYRFIVIFWTFYAICTNMQANGRTFFWVTSSKFVPVLVPTAAP